MDRIESYSEVFSVGHKAVSELFSGPVVVEEKIDGSQFSFCRSGGALLARSKGKQIVSDAPEKLFEKAVESALRILGKLPEGLVFRCEYLAKPKHNTLHYSRVPAGNLIVFDIGKMGQEYLSPAERSALAFGLGLESVPVIFSGEISSVEQLKGLLPDESCLGRAIPEGIVIKNYARFAPDKKVLMGKYVREAFKEAHAEEWKRSNPAQGDILQGLISAYRTEARFQKAAQHLRELDRLEDSPRDIGNLLKEVEADIQKECEGEIKEALWKWAWPKIARGAKAGLPEWYRNRLLENAISK